MDAFMCKLIILFESYPKSQKLIIFFHLQLDKSWDRHWPSLGHVPITDQSLYPERWVYVNHAESHAQFYD